MRVLILDDDMMRHKIFNQKLIGHVVTNVYTSKEAIDELENEDWDIVFLDHDLGGKIYVESGENTGYEVAQWLNNNPSKQPKRIVIHSYNPTGAQNMKQLLSDAEVVPGAWLMIQV